MGDYLVTLRFGEALLDVECEQAQVAADAEDMSVATPEGVNDVPSGYVRLVPAEEYVTTHTAAGSELPMVREGNMVLVSDEHVAMIQRED